MIERRDLLTAGGLALVVCAVYAPALAIGFYSDDYEWLGRMNPTLERPSFVLTKYRRNDPASILPSYVHAMHHHCAQCFEIDIPSWRHCGGLCCHTQYLRHAQPLKQTDVRPTNINLPAMDRELCRAWEGMMVVVQLLTANQDSPSG